MPRGAYDRMRRMLAGLIVLTLFVVSGILGPRVATAHIVASSVSASSRVASGGAGPRAVVTSVVTSGVTAATDTGTAPVAASRTTRHTVADTLISASGSGTGFTAAIVPGVGIGTGTGFVVAISPGVGTHTDTGTDHPGAGAERASLPCGYQHHGLGHGFGHDSNGCCMAGGCHLLGAWLPANASTTQRLVIGPTVYRDVATQRPNGLGIIPTTPPPRHNA
jgi:hypothetical protein